MKRGIALVLLVVAVAVVRPVEADSGYTQQVRVTWYRESGVMYDGSYTYPGAAACSWNFPNGTVIEFSDGRQVVCEDRGLLGSDGWIDVYGDASVPATYGDWATVTVFEP